MRQVVVAESIGHCRSCRRMRDISLSAIVVWRCCRVRSIAYHRCAGGHRGIWVTGVAGGNGGVIQITKRGGFYIM